MQKDEKSRYIHRSVRTSILKHLEYDDTVTPACPETSTCIKFAIHKMTETHH